MSRSEIGDFKCLLNAAAGRERGATVAKATAVKKVLVIGGGPAGMEAARVAALRGHAVTLWERDNTLGGKLGIAERPPHKTGISTLHEYLTSQVAKLNIKVELGKTATPETILSRGDDVVIVAKGSLPFIPRIPGVNGANVVGAEAVLVGAQVSGSDVVIIGAGVVGCETAEFLVEKGKKVTIVDVLPLEDLVKGIPIQSGMLLLSRLEYNGVNLFPSTRVERIDGNEVTVSRDGVTQTLKADCVVLATGGRPDTALFDALQGKVPELHKAGDCLKPRDMLAAIHDGYEIASRL